MEDAEALRADDDTDLKDWDTPSFQELPLGAAGNPALDTGTDLATYS